MKKKIVILGSTGSIGKIFLNILKKDIANNEIFLLTANKNINELLKQLKIFKVKNIIINDKKKFLLIKNKLHNKKINIYNNFDEIKKIFKNIKVDYTLNAISGLVGLKPTIEIIKFTKKIAIANKESIICGWTLINNKLIKHKTKFIPIDSEHFSIWSLIGDIKKENIEKVFITASGGPFNDYPLSKFNKITINQALKHPNWKMGKKISIDSATLMNKVFEIIEAKKIFNYKYSDLKILIHPKSYVHAIVKFKNGLTKLLIHDTNMKIPIFNSFYSNFEKKIQTKNLNLDILNDLKFKDVDEIKFPSIKLLKKLPNKDSLFETVVVSANDKLVALFLKKKITFQDISRILLKIIEIPQFKKLKRVKPKNIDQILKLSKYVSLKIDILVI
ncbi:1-deoxy-D-xylulose-5-phosphate reductoisomerase [Candidatus Pelagibacter sp.]|jgi:1-deoxy-D-xylulose-5-phosphate reductoisomerase|nr:1-deoxy-D-xylulose-5-phosphate reductoisomerase [Candidatus Pelagibacter sp.]